MSSPQHTQSLAEPHARGIFQGRVLSNRLICPDHYRLRLRLASFPPSRPGQFINIRCGPTEPSSVAVAEWPADGEIPRLTQPETTARTPLLRRPFSLAGRADKPDGPVELDIIYRVVGAGTAWLAELQVGSEINILGPLGNGFAINPEKPLAALVGGGTGIGPMLYLAEALAAAGKDVTAFAGARTARALPLTEEQKETFTIATDDGSLGFAGMVHEAFGQWLDQAKPRPACHEQGRMAEMVVYACGPEEMMKVVAEICAAGGIECQLALERHMACGMGTCQGCAVKVKTDAAPGWQFKLVCENGPVFDAGELVWE